MVLRAIVMRAKSVSAMDTIAVGMIGELLQEV